MDNPSKSEALEDDLLSLPSPVLFTKWSAKPNALDTMRFWKLIDEIEKLVNFSMAALKKGSALMNLTSALMRLGVGRKAILQPVAWRMMIMLQHEKPLISSREACMTVTAIAHVLPREIRRQEWVGEVMQAASQMKLAELHEGKTSAETKQRAVEVLIPLARSFLFAERFDEDLFRETFKEVNAGALDKLDIPPMKVKVLKSKLYQVHLDCKLNSRPSEFRLTPALETECKQAFKAYQVKVKSSSFLLHHLVRTALNEFRLRNETLHATESGYHLDFKVLRQKVAIEINLSNCYQAVEPSDEGKDPKTFGFVDLKVRHLELLGWKVIQLHADHFLELETPEDRVMHLKMLFQIATGRGQKRSSARKQNV